MTPYAINILPKNVQFQQMLEKKKFWIAASAYIFAAIFIALFAIVTVKSKDVKAQAEKADNELSNATALNSEIVKMQKQITKSRSIVLDKVKSFIINGLTRKKRTVKRLFKEQKLMS